MSGVTEILIIMSMSPAGTACGWVGVCGAEREKEDLA